MIKRNYMCPHEIRSDGYCYICDEDSIPQYIHKESYVLRSDKVLYVDVDDTLVIWDHMHATYTPHKAHLAKIEEFLARGQGVVIWSAGGYAWAEKIAKEFGLFGRVDAILCKPVWWMDDLAADEILLKSGHIYLKDE